MQRIINFLKNNKGATAIEYALIAGLIAVMLAATFTSFRGKINDKFNQTGNALDSKAVS